MPSPILKATLASAALSSASNILAQILTAYRDEKPFAFDAGLFLQFVTVAFITAPPNYIWQQFLERSFPMYGSSSSPSSSFSSPTGEKKQRPSVDIDLEKQQRRTPSPTPTPIPIFGSSAGVVGGGGIRPKPKLNLKNTFAKWFIDCITIGALLNTTAFFLLMGLLKFQPWSLIRHNIQTQTVPVIVAGYKIWPFASIVSFSWVPVERRIVFLNFVGLLWGIYMSLVASRV